MTLEQGFAAVFAAIDDAVERQRKIIADTLGQVDKSPRELADANYAKLNDWRGLLQEILDEINASGLVASVIEDEVPNISEEFDSPVVVTDNGETMPIGKYIKHRFTELVASGFTFSPTVLERLSTKEASHSELGLNYPLLKRVDDSRAISEQTDYCGHRNRYWKEVFTFGADKLLLCSQWYESHRERFDRWYADLSDRTRTVRTKPRSVTLLGQTYPETRWKDVLIRTCEVLYTKNPSVIGNLDTNGDVNSARRNTFARSESGIKQTPIKLSFGLWVETNQSADSVMRICRKLLSLCGYSADDISVDECEVGTSASEE